MDLLLERGVKGCTVIEVGGGVGEIQLELLQAGATQAVSVELTPTFEIAASRLLREAGFEDRVERRVMDFVEAGPQLASADIVVMNRVICCYADMPGLVGAAANCTRQVLVMSFPKMKWWTRLALTLENLWHRVARREFRAFLHPPDRIVQTAAQRGLRMLVDQRGLFWEVVMLERPPAEQS
ncbi:MAG TPA: methyltransferase domain-containing protein [Candidatus Dormibacteraeota bacterium]|nr:methyltransferase domain-containing protein [Candidatus Dormibacteraeota bacterium]